MLLRSIFLAKVFLFPLFIWHKCRKFIQPLFYGKFIQFFQFLQSNEKELWTRFIFVLRCLLVNNNSNSLDMIDINYKLNTTTQITSTWLGFLPRAQHRNIARARTSHFNSNTNTARRGLLPVPAVSLYDVWRQLFGQITAEEPQNTVINKM